MTYSPDPLTHQVLSDRAALYCSVCQGYCAKTDPCSCDVEVPQFATGDIVAEAAGSGDASVPAALDDGQIVPAKQATSRSRAVPQAEVVMIADGDAGAVAEEEGP